MTASPPPDSGALQRALLGIPLTLTVVLCDKVARMSDVLRLRTGDVMEFEKAVDRPLEVFIHNQRIARGVAVKVAEKFGLKVQEVLPPEETVRAMADLPPAAPRKPSGGPV